MSWLKHGDKVKIELEATVIEVLKDGRIDVNLNDHGGGRLGGLNLAVKDTEISEIISENNEGNTRSLGTDRSRGEEGSR